MSQRIYGIYMATPPTLSDGQVHPLLLNENGTLAELSVDADLDKETQSKSHTHTTAGTAESIVGDAAFSAGATVMVVGLDTWVAVGSSAAQAQGGDIKFPAGVPFTVRLDGTETTFHLDAATSGEVSIHQVS